MSNTNTNTTRPAPLNLEDLEDVIADVEAARFPGYTNLLADELDTRVSLSFDGDFGAALDHVIAEGDSSFLNLADTEDEWKFLVDYSLDMIKLNTEGRN